MGIFMKTACKGVFNTEQYIQAWVTIATFLSSAALPNHSQLMLTRRIHSRGKVESYSLCRGTEIETWKKMVQLASELLWHSHQNLALPHLGEI